MKPARRRSLECWRWPVARAHFKAAAADDDASKPREARESRRPPRSPPPPPPPRADAATRRGPRGTAWRWRVGPRRPSGSRNLSRRRRLRFARMRRIVSRAAQRQSRTCGGVMGSATKQASVPQAASACVIPPTAATTIFHRRARAASARRRASAAGPRERRGARGVSARVRSRREGFDHALGERVSSAWVTEVRGRVRAIEGDGGNGRRRDAGGGRRRGFARAARSFSSRMARWRSVSTPRGGARGAGGVGGSSSSKSSSAYSSSSTKSSS